MTGDEPAANPGGGARPSPPPVPLLESKLRPPPERAGIAVRTGLIERVRGGRRPVVLIEAPAGYGKTTLAASWLQSERRPFAWYAIEDADNDPAVFLAYLRTALERCGAPVDADVRPRPGHRHPMALGTALGRTFAAVSAPAVLVLDNIDALSNPSCLAAVDALIESVPAHSHLVLLARTPLPYDGLHDASRLVRLDTANLRLSDADAADVLAGAELTAGPDEVRALNAACEGWVAGLYLVALAGQAAVDHLLESPHAGVDRFVADYFRLELLGRRPLEEQEFLLDVSVFDRLSGDLCDTVLERSGSAETLAGLERSNLFLIPDGGAGEWYRLHGLFRDMLRAELDATHPGRAGTLLARAASWFEERGDLEAAVESAIAGGELGRAARIIGSLVPPLYAAGRAATLTRWFLAVDDPHVLAEHLDLATMGANFFGIQGQARLAERWANAAYHGVGDVILFDGSPGEAWIAGVRAGLCLDGAARMLVDAEIAVSLMAPASPVRAWALTVCGFAYLLAGDVERAQERFREAIDLAERNGNTVSAIFSHAALALIAAVAGDGEAAEQLARLALELADEAGLDDYAVTAYAHAAHARATLLRGRRGAAKEDLEKADRIVANGGFPHPWIAVSIFVELAHLHLAFDDPGRASELLDQIADVTLNAQDLGALGERVEELRHDLEIGRSRDDGWTSVLTTAELRLLPLLASHLSFREISLRLGISRNTVKTQAIAVYRKLNVSSRSEAVRSARELGLLRPSLTAAGAEPGENRQQL